jgi:hypothetical protein
MTLLLLQEDQVARPSCFGKMIVLRGLLAFARR